MRGTPKDGNLRSSELLEARLTGYDGNVRELTYEWTNGLGTYLYVYNSHNMYYINNTDGEIEIYNSKIKSSTNMAGRSYKDTFSGVGYCWASIYGSNTGGSGQSISDNNAYNGTITVKVKDKNGNVIAQDSHTGTVTQSGYWWNQSYKYNGIIDHSLQADMDNVTIGLFEGDKRNVKDLLGESAILHITCVESTVSQGKIVSGENNIKLTTESGDYYITGTKAGTSTDSNGDAQVNLTIKKNTCKFHEKTSGTATTTVYVFKKPTTSTTAYTLTLTGNLDDRCRYFIDGKEGVKQDDGTILFDGLKPNTQYMVEVRAEYKDENKNTKYAYAYVYDTTKPIYTGTVEVYLDGTYDSATHTVSGGTKIDLTEVTDKTNQTNTLFAKAQGSNEFIELAHKSTGTYSNILDTGLYNIYYEADESTIVDSQILTMHQADRTRYLFYNSVTYKVDDTDFSYSTHLTDTKVDVIKDTPTKDGYYFAGWKDEKDGEIYKSNEVLTTDISRPYILTAQWEKGVDVYVNITIDHFAKNNGGHNNEDVKHNVSFDLMSRPVNGTATNQDYSDVFDKPIDILWDGNDNTFSSDTFDATRDYIAETKDLTIYTAKAPVLKNAAKGYEYSVEIAKPQYEIIGLTQTPDENGNITLDVQLRYDPKNANFTFKVELDEESKELVEQHPEYKPSAVHIKVLSWYTKDYVGAKHTLEKDNWHHISQHHDTFVTLNLDKNCEATGSYPVWMYNTDKTEYYHYRIKVVSYILENGREIFTNDVADKKDEQYITTYDRYLATIEANNGDNPSPEKTKLDGAHFNTANNAQKGEVKGIIHINTHTITFEPNGGQFSDGTTENKSVDKLIEAPDLSPYTPTKNGGYTFMGWYLGDESGNVTNETIKQGDNLTKDITVRALWKDPLTIKGTTYVAGYYHLDDNKDELRTIPENERTHHVTVYLQKLLPNGYAETIDSQMMNIGYNDMSMDDVDKPMGSATYEFANVPDDGHTYRVLIQNPNYTDKYQNEPDSINPTTYTDFDKKYYTEEEQNSFIAVFGDTEPTVADVNLFLEFEPTNFKLKYKVDATRINSGFRPSNTEVLVLFNDKGLVNPQEWPVISQMYKDDKLVGNDTKLDASGIGNDSEPVWIHKPDGHTLYDYSVKLKDYTINGTKTQYDANSAPFYVYYNGSARYSATNTNPKNQTQLLTIELRPRRYVVTFNLNFTETDSDHITGMDNYYSGIEDSKRVFTALHLWSYETDFSDAIPKRDGYEFLGWYDKDGNEVTKVEADVAENVTVTAKWRKAVTVTFHANNEDIDYDIFRKYYEYGVSFEDDKKSFSLNENETLDSFYDIPEYEYSTHNKYIFKGWYLDKDNNNDSRPITFNEVYTEDTDVYAHWIVTGTVEKDANDSKITSYGGSYPGYDLIGVQIRQAQNDSVQHYGEVASGLRFVTILSEDVYKQVNALNAQNANGAEYGYALAKTATAEKYCGNTENYEIEYKAENVNGVDTTTSYKYVSNVKCSGVKDHFNSNKYRLYTAVVTFKNKEGDALIEAQAQKLLARSYIRYTDANGLLRTHYNNYTSGSHTFGTYSGCSASYAEAFELINPVG